MALHEQDGAGCRRGLQRPVEGRPVATAVVTDLDAYDDGGIFFYHQRSELRVHIIDILLAGIAAHAIAGDVQKGEHPRLRLIDYMFFEERKVSPSGGAGVHYRRHTRPESKVVRGKTGKTIRESG